MDEHADPTPDHGLLSEAEREHQHSWALLAQIARQRGAAASLPGTFPPDVEAEYQRLRAEVEALRKSGRDGRPDAAGHARFRERARALLRRLDG